MNTFVFYALFGIGFLLIATAGCWVFEKIIPYFEKLDARLAELARQKKD